MKLCNVFISYLCPRAGIQCEYIQLICEFMHLDIYSSHIYFHV